MGKTSRALLICALALGVCRGGAAAEDCKLNQVASLPVHYVHNQIWVEIAVDDTPVNFIVDTGAQYSEISRALAARLHLPVKTVPGAANGVTGSSELNAATIPTLQMGRMTAHNEPFFVDANFGDGSDGGPTGLFGADFLSNYGIEIDLADQKFNLYARDYCPDHVVYWAPEYLKMPFDRGTSDVPYIHIDVAVDGHPIHGILDTGATSTLLRLATAHSVLNYDETKAGDQSFTAIGASSTRTLTGYFHRFASLEFGPITLKNPMMGVVPMDMGKSSAPDIGSHINSLRLDQPAIMVGMDVIAKLRLFVDYRYSGLFFTLAQPPHAEPAAK